MSVLCLFYFLQVTRSRKSHGSLMLGQNRGENEIFPCLICRNRREKKPAKEEKKNLQKKEKKKPHKDSNVKRVQMRLRADAASHRIGACLWSIWAEVTFSRRPRWEERPPRRGLAFRGRHLFMWIHRLCPQRPAQYTARPTAAPLKLHPYWAWRRPPPLHPPTPTTPSPFKRAPVELQSAPPSLCKSRPTVAAARAWRVLCIQTKIRCSSSRRVYSVNYSTI